jgi:hypothetical protein
MYWVGTRGYSRYRPGTGVQWLMRYGRRAARGDAVARRRVRVRCRGQQRVPGGLRADRGRGRVPHRRDRRGQDPEYVVPFRGDLLYLPAGLLLLHQQQQCVLQRPRGRRRQLWPTAAVRRTRHHRCAAAHADAPTRVCCAVLAGGASYNANGLIIGTHTYIRTHVYTHMCPFAFDGARRRCRAAYGSAGGRRTGMQGRGTYGYSQGTQTRLPKKGTQNRVLNRVLTAAAKVLRVLVAVFVGNGWAVLGRVVHTRSMAVHIGYSRGTQRVLPGTGYLLTGHSRGTHTSGSSHRLRRCAAMRARVQRQEGYSRGTPRVLIGCSRGLTRYAHGYCVPATHPSLLRVLVADWVGRSGRCAAVRGTRA